MEGDVKTPCRLRMLFKGRDCEAPMGERLLSRWFLQDWPRGLSSWHPLTKSLSRMLGTAIPEGKKENKVFRRDLLTIPCWIPAQKCKGSASESYCFVGNPVSHAKLVCLSWLTWGLA